MDRLAPWTPGARVPRNGDMLGHAYLVADIPPIVCGSALRTTSRTFFLCLQVSVLLTFSFSYFVVPFWACLCWTAAAVAVASYASAQIWSLPPDVQRDRRSVVALVAAIVVCYYSPLALQALMDVALLGRADTVPVLCATCVLGSLVAGGAVFAAGVPERWLPNTFDYVGSSHQLMHVAGLTAHALEYVFMLELLHRHLGREPQSATALLGDWAGVTSNFISDCWTWPSVMLAGGPQGQGRDWSSMLGAIVQVSKGEL